MALMLRATLVLVVAVLALVAPAALAIADSSSEYGEVTRFGGFDNGAYNSGHFVGTPTPGKFLDPTGFTVDPQDNTVYVVDRTSSYKVNPTLWRIQQLSPAGAVLGSTTFTLPNSNFGASAIVGLAVDHRAARLYALMIGSPPSSSPNKLTPVAQEVLGWSTVSKAGKLEAAPGLASDPFHTTGGLVSSETQLRSGSNLPYAPQGIAIDRLGIPGVDDPLVIEVSDLVSNYGFPITGNAIVQQIATDGPGRGNLLASWSGASVASQLHGSWGPLGISANPDGSLSVLLDAERLTATDAYVVKLSADLSQATVLNADVIEPSLKDFDQAPMWVDAAPFSSLAGVGVSFVYGAGPEIVQLSTLTSSATNGLYAADLFSQQAGRVGEPTDYQFSPTSTGPEYWVSGPGQYSYESNIGVRLLEPNAEGTIANPHGNTIVNTLGNASIGGPCDIVAPEAVLAGGAEGTLWVLDRGPKAEAPSAGGVGRQIIELAPGAGPSCPRPSGTFTMTPEGGSSQLSEETLTVSAGTQVTFDASSIDLRHGKPFAYEWDLDGNATNGPRHDGFEASNEMQPPYFYFPPPSVTYTYEHPGRYTVRARVRSDYGAYTAPPATVIVTSPLHPEAHFVATSTASSEQVKFDTAGSTPGAGAIANYHWSWGDGSSEDDGPQMPIVEHTYAASGSYAVTLTVTNSSYQSATSLPQTVVVQANSSVSAEPVETIAGPPPGLLLPIYRIPPAPSPDKVATRLFPRARFSRGALTVTLACPATKALCVGTVRVEIVTSFVARKRGSKRRARRLLLGRAHFSIAAGAHTTVSVHLSAQGMALLEKVKRLKALVIVAAHDSLGDPGTAASQLTLNVSAVHAHK